MKEAYDALESYLDGSNYVCGDVLTIADLSIVATLSTVLLVVPFDKDYPNITKWFTKMKELPYYKDGNQVGLDKLKALLDKIPE